LIALLSIAIEEFLVNPDKLSAEKSVIEKESPVETIRRISLVIERIQTIFLSLTGQQ